LGKEGDVEECGIFFWLQILPPLATDSSPAKGGRRRREGSQILGEKVRGSQEVGKKSNGGRQPWGGDLRWIFSNPPFS